jgi:Holliday junction resolvasome RuvABC endonuclease subunit
MVGQSPGQIKREVSVVGIDPAVGTTGLCRYRNGVYVLDIATGGRRRGGKRLVHLRQQVLEAVLAEPTDLVALEGYAIGAVGRSFTKGELGGVIKMELALHEIPIVVVQPTMLKAFAANNGGASKETMMRCARERLGVDTDDDNLADAAWLSRFAYVYLTGDSNRRRELEAVQRHRAPKKRKAAVPRPRKAI